MRKNAREDAFRLIFEQYINKGESEEQLQRYFAVVEAERAEEEEPLFVNKPTKQDNVYVRQIVEGVTANLEEIDMYIRENLQDWEMERVSKISIAALRVAIFELLFMDDIPSSVSANEAVEIAKKYDSPEAGAFVNGVLGSVISDME